MNPSGTKQGTANPVWGKIQASTGKTSLKLLCVNELGQEKKARTTQLIIRTLLVGSSHQMKARLGATQSIERLQLWVRLREEIYSRVSFSKLASTTISSNFKESDAAHCGIVVSVFYL